MGRGDRESSGEKHSHWSTSFEILCSNWLRYWWSLIRFWRLFLIHVKTVSSIIAFKFSSVITDTHQCKVGVEYITSNSISHPAQETVRQFWDKFHKSSYFIFYMCLLLNSKCHCYLVSLWPPLLELSMKCFVSDYFNRDLYEHSC